MNKRTTELVARIVILLALFAAALQITFATTGHPSRALAAFFAWPILALVGIGLLIWSRRLKS